MSLEKFYLKVVFIKNYFHRELHIFLYLVFLLFYLLYFSNTGCLIYPASFTCFDSFSWSIPKESY